MADRESAGETRRPDGQSDAIATAAPAGPADDVRSATRVHPALLALLRCPEDRGEVDERGTTLVCRACGRTFPVTDGVADMTVRRRG